MTEQEAGAILVAPNRFPGMDRERALAGEFGCELVVAADDDEFYATLPRACLVFMSTSTLLPAVHIEGAGRLRGILRYGVGYDNIDVAAAARLGIPVTNVPASASEEVATHAVAMALDLQRRISQGDALIRAGSWGGDFMNGVQRLSTQTVGIVGLGRIGWKTAERFQVFGCRVIGYDPFLQESPWPLVGLEQILAEADIVSLHLPLTDETLHLLGERELAALKPGAIVINVSRGGLVDEAALAAALGSGHLGGAGIDVFEREPLAADHPLRDSPRTLLSAHMAWKSDQSLDAYQDVVVRIARQILSGAKPDFVVNGVE